MRERSIVAAEISAPLMMVISSDEDESLRFISLLHRYYEFLHQKRLRSSRTTFDTSHAECNINV